MTIITFKTKEDSPNYGRAVSPATSCSTCRHFQMRWCTEYDFAADPSWTCDSWQRRDEGPRSVPSNVPSAEDPIRLAISTTKSVPATFTSFKDVQGRWRWILKSSNAFEDREGELITTKALARDVMRTDKTLEFGPLRWWHVGNPQWKNPMDWRSVVAGKGLDIGDCDFSAMDGPVLIESGTFRSDKLAEAISLKAAEFRASLGFSHPLDEPDQDGLFHHIKRFERSLTPANKASNMRTGLVVTKERVMDQDKLAKFKEMVGEQIAEEALQDAQSTTKEAREAGIREKAQEPGDDVGLDTITAETEALMAQIASFKARTAPKGTTATNVDEGKSTPITPSAIVEKAHEEPDGDEVDEEPDGDEVYIGDMTGPEFVGLLQEALSPMFESHSKALDLHGKLAAANDSMKEMKTYLGGMAQKDSTIAEMKEQIQGLQISLKEAVGILEELTGDLPKELNKPRGTSYKASEGMDNVIPPTHPIYQDSQTEAASPLAWIDSFVVAQQQQQTPVLQPTHGNVNGRSG